MRALFLTILMLKALVASSLGYGVTVGKIAPPIELPSLANGRLLSLEGLRGKVVLVDFWSSWCASCRQSLPYFDTLRQKLSGEAFEIYAVNLDDDINEAITFLKEYPVTYSVVWDARQNSPEQYVIRRMPTSFLIDQAGVVRAIYVEFKKSDIAGFEADIRRLLDR
jgi:thiol-disulfide isomerase/thioredoxin